MGLAAEGPLPQGFARGITFIKIADRVEVTIALKAKRVSGSPSVFKQ
jgi:hypothetical protein